MTSPFESNESSSSEPPREDQESTDSVNHETSTKAAPGNGPSQVGDEISPPESSVIRRGSPFARDPEVDRSDQDARLAGSGSGSPFASDPSLAYDAASTLDPEWGVLKAAIWASAVVLLFAIACWGAFPGGGTIVTSLGSGLSILGLFSSRPFVASFFLACHAALFLACYSKLLV